ncbi:ABC transporter permease [Paraflavitalea pollutisoli]|uniref:ABC transporter permease n=1 Tax=Paraflavitalea pollutisoli TaxID=3034143 RepID=UPI0023ED2CC5|nr:ABC transporter permease [Paraflavitalea sp. H1-2-19X]
MIKNYLKVSIRYLLRNKVFSLINLLGLAIGLTVCMMIFLFVTNEFSFDQFHNNGDRIYRVMRQFDDNGTRRNNSFMAGPYGPALRNDFPDAIGKMIRVEPGNNLITFGEKSFNEKKIIYADSGFFTFFTFPLIAGDPATVLNNPESVVLTESTAKKYFGNANPMGQIITMNQEAPLKVTGIVKDIPSNSHLDFDLVLPLARNYGYDNFNKWNGNRLHTYVMLNEHVNPKQLENQFPRFMDKYMGEFMAQRGKRYDLSLTPLHDIYFNPANPMDESRSGNKSVVYIFLSVAALILLIACINFLNLSTIRSAERGKEVGLRKVVGALRYQLMWQFITESILLTLISCIIATGLLLALLPWYNNLLDNTLSFSRLLMPIAAFVPLAILIVGLVAGSYPALVLSSFSPIVALKGKLRAGKGGAMFRKSLVVFQFSISVFLIICTIIINKQMSYVKNKDLGYNEEQTVIIPLDNMNIQKGKYVLRNELQGRSEVVVSSTMSGEPGGYFDGMAFLAEGKGSDPFKFKTEFSDFEFAKTLGLKIIAGRDFSAQFPTDSSDALLINQTAAAELGFTPEQAIGKWMKNVSRDSVSRRIVGVVEDFNFVSLKEKVQGLVIAPTPGGRRVVLARLKPGQIEAGLSAIREAYKRVAPAYPFEYSFLDQKFDTLYKADIRQQTILSLFSGLAIVIACMGLFGLASFTAAKRIKEIGIRKVLGSSVQDIVVLLLKDLLKPVLLAALIATPIGYLIMYNWLQNFAYHTGLEWWIFIASAGITIGIALFTISYKAIQAALLNPAKSLRID